METVNNSTESATKCELCINLDLTSDESLQIENILNISDKKELLIECMTANKQRQHDRTVSARDNGMKFLLNLQHDPVFTIETLQNSEIKPCLTAYLNIYADGNVIKPTFIKLSCSENLGYSLKVPALVSQPRYDLDHIGNKCAAIYDVNFHSDLCYLSKTSDKFQKIIESVALDSIESCFSVRLARNYDTNSKSKFRRTALRTKSENSNDLESADRHQFKYVPSEICTDSKSEPFSDCMDKENKPIIDVVEPKYKISYGDKFNVREYQNVPDVKSCPIDMIISVELPLMDNEADFSLDLSAEEMNLECDQYKLRLSNFPYPISDLEANAKFDKTTRILTVTLPVLPNVPAQISAIHSSPHEQVSAMDMSKRHKDTISNSDANSGIKFGGECSERDESTTFPDFNHFQTKDEVIFILHTDNINPETVSKHVNSDRNLCKVTYRLTDSVALNYSFCVKFRDAVFDDTIVHTGDTNLVIKIRKCKFERGPWKDFEAGADEKSLQSYNFLCEENIRRRLNALELQNISSVDDAYKVDVQSMCENELKVNLELSKANNSIKKDLENGETTAEDNCRDAKSISKGRKVRSMSESATDDVRNLIKLRGILKSSKSSLQRTMSESNEDTRRTDNSSLDSQQSPSSPDIPEDYSTEDQDKKKKTVRFNDNVSKSLFRCNSSILGQRKKNQRKKRNKIRAAERRYSESGNSSCSELENLDDNLTTDNPWKDSKLMLGEILLLNDSSAFNRIGNGDETASSDTSCQGDDASKDKQNKSTRNRRKRNKINKRKRAGGERNVEDAYVGSDEQILLKSELYEVY